MHNKYWIVLKTGEAEIKALEKSSDDVIHNITPIIEITRGRKITRGEVTTYPYDNRLKKLKKIFYNQTVGIDATCVKSLTSEEVDRFYIPDDGYKNWVDFLVSLKNEKVFKEIIPAILFNFDDDDFEINIEKEILTLKEHFNTLLYRNTLTDNECYDDISLIKDIIDISDVKILLDCQYTPQSAYGSIAEKCVARINNIRELTGIKNQFIIAATSFPNNVKDLGDTDSDTYSISEIKIFELIKEKCDNIIYGDYASINPIRNDLIRMARGWIPRIDVPCQDIIYYYKQRRPSGTSAYAATYTEVAHKVRSDKRFPEGLEKNWGIEQIKKCSEGSSPGSSPSFWISVRMNIYLEQQCERIYSKK